VLSVAGCTNAPPPPLVSPTEASTIPQEKLNEVVVGIDELAGGYNPHTLADQSTVTTALSSLLLPSAFRTAPDGTPRLDTTIMVSAEVTATDPYTVTYEVRRDASWSDGAPVAAEDFVYLWQRMRDEPGLVEPAGYRLISDIASREGGKTVEVTFAKPYPGWRSLFSDLLPAHLLKDLPGGWGEALTDSFPATAGPYAVKTIDAARGEIILERNDRYWERPTALDQIVLRRSTHTGTVSALAGGDDQVALVRADAIADNLLADLAASTPLTTAPVPRPEVVQVLLRPVSAQLADQRVRRALVAALDRDALIVAGSGNGPSAGLRADSLVVPPSATGYTATLPQGAPPARPDPALAEQLLTEAGYTRSAGGQWGRDGSPLTVNLAAPEGVEPYTQVAELVRGQLVAAGITVVLTTPNAEQLFTELLPGTTPENQSAVDSRVDIAVVPRASSGDFASDLAASFGCVTGSPGGSTPVPANSAAFCDESLQPAIEAALTGETMLSDALAQIEPVLWQQAVAVPLFQVADVLAVLPTVSGVDAGAPLAGVLAGAAEWRRLDR
jgi:ABC-type transport system substrate-binding protein